MSNDMQAAMQGDTKLNYLMQTAAKIKGAQMAQGRRKFETWPTFLQNTVFHPPAVVELRALPFAERMDAAQQLKAEGNNAYKVRTAWLFLDCAL
jgi:hypothetical protein